MPRVRFTARGWLATAVVGAAVWAAPALAAPPAAGKQVAAPAPVAAGVRPGEIEARRRTEMDALQRQDAADALKRLFNIDVDWRRTPLDKLIDIRVRAAKAADLQERLGVSVDWQRYSWIELEALRRTLLSFEQYRNSDVAVAASSPREPLPPTRDDALVRPTFTSGEAGRAGRRRALDGSRRHHQPDLQPPAARGRRSRRGIPTASSGRRSRSGRAGRPWRPIRMG